MLVKISDLFDTFNGYASSNIKDIEEFSQGNNYIPYKRPSNNILNTIAGYVNSEHIPSKYIFENSIMISTDGEGSHTYSYFIKYKFVPNSNVMVLKPKYEFTDIEMIIYSRIITHNRYKFQYGRKPKGTRITEILIPDIIEIKKIISDISNKNIINFDLVYSKFNLLKKEPVLLPNIEKWKSFKLDSIFKLLLAYPYHKNNLTITNNGIPYVTRSAFNNGIVGFIDCDNANLNISSGNVLSIGAEGCISFYHEYSFICGNKVTILKNEKINKFNAIFLKNILDLEMKKVFSYGRAATYGRLKELSLMLPVDEDMNPDWILMEDYIKSLPYSEYI